MESKILVTYASGMGATQEIARKIGDVLQQAGLAVDVISVKAVKDLAPYSAVILGSAVYVGAWMKEAAAFLEDNEKALAERQVWIFSSGPTGDGDPVNLLNGWRLPAKLQPVADRIRPRDITVFHGYINPKKLVFIQRWVIKSVIKKPFGDYRDWKQITAWAEGIADVLKNGKSVEQGAHLTRLQTAVP